MARDRSVFRAFGLMHVLGRRSVARGGEILLGANVI
jgi:hypothetical protein